MAGAAETCENLSMTPGSLAGWLSATDLSGVSRLRLGGTADVRDFRALAETLPSSVKELDLSGLSVSSYTYATAQPDGRSYFPAGELPAWALFSLPLERVSLPLSITSIGEGALAATGLTSVAVPPGVVVIGEYAFHDSAELSHVTFPETLRVIGRGAFSRCVALTDADLAATSLISVPDNCFAGAISLSDVSLPRQLEHVGSEAFRSTSVRSLSLPDVATFSDYALAGMPLLEEVTLSAGAGCGRGLLMADGRLAVVREAPDVLPALFAAACGSLDVSDLTAEAMSIGPWALAGNYGESLRLAALVDLAEGGLADIGELRQIDARDLGASVPAASEAAFGATDLSAVKLIVADGTESLWGSHPVWSRFNIVSDRLSGLESATMADLASIGIRLRGRTLCISSGNDSEPLRSVAVYAPDGRLLLSRTLSCTAAEIDLTGVSADYVIAVAATAASSKAGKIRL